MTALLILIYGAFVSLGLPDSLLGSAWPVIQPELGVPLSYAGLVSMLIAGGTVIASLLSDRMTKKLGVGLVTALSVLLTALGLLGFSLSNSFALLCLFALPYGLGAGAVDAALNNFVALHYTSRHMSWLHCFWGVGATAGPYIMSWFLFRGADWQGGYRAVFWVQAALTAILFLTLPLWRRGGGTSSHAEAQRPKPLAQVLCIPHVKLILIAFFCYSALETTAGLWVSTYLVESHGLVSGRASQFAALFYIGITVGRFLSGLVADRFGDRGMIRIGLGTILAGLLLLLNPAGGLWSALTGLLLVGLGCAPIYPSIIHATPHNFGRENSQALVGVQMASAYIGTTFMPPLFGFLAQRLGIRLYPVYLLVLGAAIAVMTERLNRRLREERPAA